MELIPIQCPYCGETIDAEIEALDESQELIQDCTVCCRPIQLQVDPSDDGYEITPSRTQ